MINASQDFNSALSYVTQDMDYTNAKLSSDMSSAAFNYTFLEIENNINILYEKIRLLEDIRDYTKDFVIRAVKERRTKLIENLKTIETLTDEIQSNNSMVSVMVPDKEAAVYDRDGSTVAQFEYDNGDLVVPGFVLSVEDAVTVTSNGPVKATKVKKQDPVQGDYSSTDLVPLSSAEPFVSCTIPTGVNKSHFDIYQGTESDTEGFKVQYDITFSGKTRCNYIKLNPVNCKIIDIKIYDINNIMTQVNPEQRYFPLTRIVKVVVTVECKNYERRIIAMPSQGTQDSFDLAVTGGEIYG